MHFAYRCSSFARIALHLELEGAQYLLQKRRHHQLERGHDCGISIRGKGTQNKKKKKKKKKKRAPYYKHFYISWHIMFLFVCLI